jgi:hypothetical protein
LVREGVAREDELAVLPFEREAHRPCHDVHGGPGRDLHPVLVVDHRELVVRELVDLDLPSHRGEPAGAPVDVPGKRFDLVVDEVFRPPFGVILRPVRTPDARGPLPASDPASNVPGSKVANVIGMEVADEDLVDQVVRDLQYRKVGDRARSEVEDEFVAVP